MSSLWHPVFVNRRFSTILRKTTFFCRCLINIAGRFQQDFEKNWCTDLIRLTTNAPFVDYIWRKYSSLVETHSSSHTFGFLLLRIRSAHLGIVRRNAGVNSVWGWCLRIQRFFCVVYDYTANLGKDYLNPKRKLDLTTHFSEIIKLQFEKKNATHRFVF